MSNLGAISQYALSVQNMQMALIKNQVNMQQEMIEILMETTQQMVLFASLINLEKGKMMQLCFSFTQPFVLCLQDITKI